MALSPRPLPKRTLRALALSAALVAVVAGPVTATDSSTNRVEARCTAIASGGYILSVHGAAWASSVDYTSGPPAQSLGSSTKRPNFEVFVASPFAFYAYVTDRTQRRQVVTSFATCPA